MVAFVEADVWTLALGKQDDSVPFSSSEGKAGLSVCVSVLAARMWLVV